MGDDGERAPARDFLIEVHRLLVRGAGLEPARVTPYAPQTYVSTSSTIRADKLDLVARERHYSRQPFIFNDFYQDTGTFKRPERLSS